jgi:hypothetical protein
VQCASMRLYTDVLAHVFSFAPLRDVMRCALVSRLRAATALHGPRRDAESVGVWEAYVNALCTSRLRRLIGALEHYGSDTTGTCVRALPHLRTLRTCVQLQAWSAHLHTLYVTTRVETFPSTLTSLTVAHLPEPPALAACTQLRTFASCVAFNGIRYAARLTDAHADALGTLVHLQHVHGMGICLPYARVLRMHAATRAVPLRVHTWLAQLDADAPLALARIPGDVCVNVEDASHDLEFLAHLPRVTGVRVWLFAWHDVERDSMRAAFAILARMPRLHILVLDEMLDTSVPYAELATLRHVRQFTAVFTPLHTLDFLATWPVEEVHLTGTRLPDSAKHVLTQLLHVRSCTLRDAFASPLPLDAQAVQALRARNVFVR